MVFKEVEVLGAGIVGELRGLGLLLLGGLKTATVIMN